MRGQLSLRHPQLAQNDEALDAGSSEGAQQAAAAGKPTVEANAATPATMATIARVDSPAAPPSAQQ